MAPSTDEDEEEKVESAVDTMRREREERRLMMKRKREEERLEARNSKTTLARIPRHEKSRTAGLNLPEGNFEEILRLSLRPITGRWVNTASERWQLEEIRLSLMARRV